MEFSKSIKSKFPWFLAVAASLALSSANAAVVTSITQPLLTPSPDAIDSYLDDLGGGIETAESLTATADIDVQNISWWGSYDGTPSTDDFIVRVFADAAGSVGGLLYELASAPAMRSLTGVQDIFGEDVYAYSLDLASGALALEDGLSYWLSIVNISNTGNNPVGWYWAESSVGDGANAYREPALSPDWIVDSPSIDLAYEITGVTDDPDAVVPVPSTLLIMLLPLGALAMNRMRRGVRAIDFA